MHCRIQPHQLSYVYKIGLCQLSLLQLPKHIGAVERKLRVMAISVILGLIGVVRPERSLVDMSDMC